MNASNKFLYTVYTITFRPKCIHTDSSNFSAHRVQANSVCFSPVFHIDSFTHLGFVSHGFADLYNWRYVFQQPIHSDSPMVEINILMCLFAYLTRWLNREVHGTFWLKLKFILKWHMAELYSWFVYNWWDLVCLSTWWYFDYFRPFEAAVFMVFSQGYFTDFWNAFWFWIIAFTWVCFQRLLSFFDILIPTLFWTRESDGLFFQFHFSTVFLLLS